MKFNRKGIFRQRGNFEDNSKQKTLVSRRLIYDNLYAGGRWYRDARFLNHSCLKKSCGRAKRRCKKFLNETHNMPKQKEREFSLK